MGSSRLLWKPFLLELGTTILLSDESSSPPAARYRQYRAAICVNPQKIVAGKLLWVGHFEFDFRAGLSMRIPDLLHEYAQPYVAQSAIRRDSPACVLGDFPPSWSLRALSMTSFLGVTLPAMCTPEAPLLWARKGIPDYV